MKFQALYQKQYKEKKMPLKTDKEHQVKPDDKNVGDFKLDDNGDKIP